MNTTGTATETGISPDQTVGELVARHPQMKALLEKLEIDYCCGGKRPLREAVEQADLDWATVSRQLQAALAAPAAPQGTEEDWNTAPLSRLADHILDTHHAFMKEQLPRLDGLLSRVQRAHGALHGDMLTELRRLFDNLRAEIESHLMKEEEILFPSIKDIDHYVTGDGERPEVHCGSVANPIRQMEYEHDRAGQALAGMRAITNQYTLPPDACLTFAALYAGLQAVEDDLRQHIHLENNILFPKSIEQEQGMG